MTRARQTRNWHGLRDCAVHTEGRYRSMGLEEQVEKLRARVAEREKREKLKKEREELRKKLARKK